MRQRKSKRILTLLVAIAVMLSLSTTAYAQTELQSAQPTASASASEEATQEPATAEPSAEASPSAVESAQPTATPEQSEPAKDEAQPAEPDQPSEDIEWEPIKCTYSAAPLVKTQGAAKARRAMAKAKANSEADGLIKSKTVTANANGSYTITLEQYVTGTVTTETKSKPVDIVLVLDVSGSMDDPFGGGDATKKINALKTAVKNFIDQVSVDAKESNVDHQIAIVKYAGDLTSKVGNDTYRDGGYTYNYSQVVKNLTSASSAATLKNAVNSLSPAGSTRADLGMAHAKNIINKIPTNRDSTKVVVMFTDGVPTSLNEFSDSVANGAISNAKGIKDKGATVYTIGVMSGADVSLPINYNTENFNKYMHCVSSNYPHAKSMNNYGSLANLPENKSYYLAAGDSGKLSNVFEQISQEVTKPAIELDATTVVKDVVTQYFDMPTDTSDIKVYTADYKGKDGNGNRTFGARQDFNATVNIDKDKNTISVSNFNFSDNCVKDKEDGTVAGGKKLIIEFTVTPKDGFLGGNNVPTNGEDSGIYNEKKGFVDKFEVPKVNVPINEITPTVKEKNVYLMGSVSQDQMLEDASVKATDWNGRDVALDLTKNDFGLEDWQYAFVKLDVTTSDAKSNLTDDTDFTLSASIKPKEASTTNVGTPNDIAGKSATATGKINVFKPELTFKDSQVDYLDDAPTDYDANKVSEAWKHGTTDSGSVDMLGKKPTLDLTYTPGEGISNGKIVSDKDIEVKVTVKINDDDVTNQTTFEHKPCDSECGWTQPTEKGNPAFLLHCKNTVLVISKTVSGGSANPNEHFTFEIKGDALKEREVDAAINTECSEHSNEIVNGKLTFDANGVAKITLKHGEKLTLDGLKAGNVSITETNKGAYTLTAKVDNEKADITGEGQNVLDKVELVSGKTKTAEMNNNFGSQPILGVDVDNMPYIMIGAAVVICAAGAIFIARRNRRRHSDF